MGHEQLEKIVFECVSELTGKPLDQLHGDLSLSDDLDLDSVDILDLSFEIEQKTGTDKNIVELLKHAKRGSLEHEAVTIKDIVRFLES